MNLPTLPCSFDSLSSRLSAAHTREEVVDIVRPFKDYEAKLRQIYAQEPNHQAVSQSHLVPIYQKSPSHLVIKARELSAESKSEQEKYLLPLTADKRRKTGSDATTATIRQFKKNFDIFSESSLVDLKWDNVIAAGSSVVTALLPVSAPHNVSKRALRSYYHETLAPASDVDLFLYGLDETQAVEKIKQIEADIRDAILAETTVVRTKNTITIVSEYPTRHIQIVLRLYRSVSEILTGFDVDCACVAYDGTQVWASPRALAAFVTQTNTIDLTRRSPSYENRLSKYAHRQFEAYWPLLDRSRVDPTIFERSFNRVLGLARLLVLEKLPHPQDRDEYRTQRRFERGRPAQPWSARFRHQLPGNVKDAQPDDVAEWVEEDDISSYNTFTIPYGPRYTANKIERLLFKQDLLKNAEWNKPRDRETNLHRHPAFFGRIEDVIHDCCGYCPQPVTDADLVAWEEESKLYVSGDISFMKDDPGRQLIGSFRPLTDDDWTEMAYIGNTTRLCQSIVDEDLEGVADWFDGEDADIKRRDHTGRTPLQLAVMSSTPDIVQYLIDRGARINARLYNGFTALHLAAWRGSSEIVKALLDKSADNQAEEDAKEEKRKQARRAAAGLAENADGDTEMTQLEDDRGSKEAQSDSDSLMDEVSDDDSDDRMTGSFVKIADVAESDEIREGEDGPDVYNVDVVAWDSPCSALHLAILAGHEHIIRLLIEDYAADVMLPVKLVTNGSLQVPRSAIFTLLLPLDLPTVKATAVVRTLLSHGASPLQADMNHITSLHYIVDEAKTEILKVFQAENSMASSQAVKHLDVRASWRGADVKTPLLSAVRSGSPEVVKEILEVGAQPTITLEAFVQAYKADSNAREEDDDALQKTYRKSVTQPIIEAARCETMVDIVLELLKRGADVNTLAPDSWYFIDMPTHTYYRGGSKSLLDLVRERRQKLEDYANEMPLLEKAPLKQDGPLHDDAHYLQGIQSGTYQHWSALKDLEVVNFVHTERARWFQHEFKTRKDERLEPGFEEKTHAAASLARKFKAVENRLIEEGAKTFDELYPHLKEIEEHDKAQGQSDEHDDDLSYRTKIRFYGRDVTPKRQSHYVDLFEAAFIGDIDTVKRLCLSREEGRRPLHVTTKDSKGFSPFSIALLRGHQQLAMTCLDIAAAQYEVKKDTKRMHYSLQPFDRDDEAYDSDDSVNSDDRDDDKPRFFHRLVDDDFTIDDVEALAKDVKSDVSPATILSAQCEIWRFMAMSRERALHQCGVSQGFNPTPYVGYRDQEKPWAQFNSCVENEGNRTSFSLWTYTVATNNVQLLNFLLESEVKYSMEEADELLKSLDPRKNELILAMNLGHLEIVDVLLRHRGALLPLHHLAEQSGVAIAEAPKFYQGLSVHGHKRKDWARQDGHLDRIDKSESGSPLLNAIMESGLDTIDYFLSDTPERKYEEFCLRFRLDQRIRALSEAKGGVQSAVRNWMSSRTKLSLHIAVMSWPAGASTRLRYLLRKVPTDYLEAQSATGDTPLHLALKLGNIPAFEVLLAAGANQRTRDKRGRNLIHTIWDSARDSRVSLLKRTVGLLDQAILPDLLLEKCSGTEPGSLTPLALYLHSNNRSDTQLLEIMLKTSNGKDLTVMDGAGDYPLHVDVRNNNLERAEYFARKRPDLLYKENATGMTPIDVAETRYLQSRLNTGPSLKTRVNDVSILDKEIADFVEKNNSASADSKTASFKEEGDYDDLPQSDPMYSNLVRIARQTQQTRHLVSVLDANEVARRLANQQHRKNAENRRQEAQGLKSRWNRYSSRDQSSEPEDEVDKWFGIAQSRIERVPFLQHADDTTEAVEAALQKWREFAEGEPEDIRCFQKAEDVNTNAEENDARD